MWRQWVKSFWLVRGDKIQNIFIAEQLRDTGIIRSQASIIQTKSGFPIRKLL